MIQANTVTLKKLMIRVSEEERKLSYNLKMEGSFNKNLNDIVLIQSAIIISRFYREHASYT